MGTPPDHSGAPAAGGRDGADAGRPRPEPEPETGRGTTAGGRIPQPPRPEPEPETDRGTTAGDRIPPTPEPEPVRGGDGGEPAVETPSGRGVASVERAARVLFCLARAGAPVGVTGVASELGISKAVVHRILTSLSQRDLVTMDPGTRLYSLGPAVLELAASYRSQLDIRLMATATMRDLVETTGETSTLSILHNDRRVYVDQVTPNREVRMTVEVGASFPLHAGASSKAFLAWLPEDRRRAYLASPLESLTDATITDSAELRRELSLIRQQGFAVSLGERQAGAASVAAPLLDEQLSPVAVLSVCGPLQRFTPAIAGVAAEVVRATRTLSRKLGAPVE